MAQRVTIRVTPSDAVLLARIKNATGAETDTETHRYAFKFAVAYLEGWSHADVLAAHERAARNAHEKLLAAERRRRSERRERPKGVAAKYRAEVARLSKELVELQDYVEELEKGVVHVQGEGRTESRLTT